MEVQCGNGDMPLNRECKSRSQCDDSDSVGMLDDESILAAPLH